MKTMNKWTNFLNKLPRFSRYLMCFVFLSLPTFSIELISKDSNKQLMFEQAVADKVLMAKLEVLLVEKGIERVIPLEYPLKEGNEIRFRLTTSLDTQYQLFELDDDGKTQKGMLLEGLLSKNKNALIPTPEQGVLGVAGQEVTSWIQFVFTSKEKRQPDLAVKNRHKQAVKILKVGLRNIKLHTYPDQKIQYDADNDAIYISYRYLNKMDNPLSINIGLGN